jgi:hypothetical protein
MTCADCIAEIKATHNADTCSDEQCEECDNEDIEANSYNDNEGDDTSDDNARVRHGYELRFENNDAAAMHYVRLVISTGRAHELNNDAEIVSAIERVANTLTEARTATHVVPIGDTFKVIACDNAPCAHCGGGAMTCAACDQHDTRFDSRNVDTWKDVDDNGDDCNDDDDNVDCFALTQKLCDARKVWDDDMRDDCVVVNCPDKQYGNETECRAHWQETEAKRAQRMTEWFARNA